MPGTGQKEREICRAGPLHDQDSSQEGHQGRQEDDVWKGGEGQGEACEDRREGIPCCSSEASYLRQPKYSNSTVNDWLQLASCRTRFWRLAWSHVYFITTLWVDA